jgi:hypothetical protein
MRRIAFLIVILFTAVSANAEMRISVDGVVDPAPFAMKPYEELSIGIWGDGTTEPGNFVLGFCTECSASNGYWDTTEVVINYFGISRSVEVTDDRFVAESFGIFNPFVTIELDDYSPKTPLDGQLVDGIGLVPLDITDYRLLLLNSSGVLLDSQDFCVGACIPEPGMVALLGLGALILKRRK